MAVKFDFEVLTQLQSEVEPLLREHWSEVALYQDKVPLRVDWARYAALEKQNAYVFFTARRDGELVGYAGWFVNEHMHYLGHSVAMNDVIYLKPAARGRTGLGLIRHSEYVLKVLGVDRILWHLKPDHDWSKILTRMGYTQEELIYGKYTGA